MRRRVKYEVIRETSLNIKRELDELKNEVIEMNKNIELIRNSYVGKDAETIIFKYKEKLKSIVEYVKVVEEYNNCFEWVSGAYKDNHKNTVKDLNIDNILDENVMINNQITNLKGFFEDGGKNV